MSEPTQCGELAMGEQNPTEWNPDSDCDAFRSTGTVLIDGLDAGYGMPIEVSDHWANRAPDMGREHAATLARAGEFDGVEERLLPLLHSELTVNRDILGTFRVVTRLDEPCDCQSQDGPDSWEYGVRSVFLPNGTDAVECLRCSAEHSSP